MCQSQSWDWRGELIRNSKGVCTPRGNSGSQRKLKCPETARNFSITAKSLVSKISIHMWADTSGHGSRPYLKLSARPVWLKRRLVSLASQADVLRVSSRVPAPRVTNPWERLRGRLQTPARPTLRVVNNWEESAAFEMTFANGLTFLFSRIWMKKRMSRLTALTLFFPKFGV